MNKMLFSEGGQPFFLDDLEFLQKTTHDMITSLASVYGNVVLSGCEVSSYDPVTRKFSWRKGALIINNEIYVVDEGEIQVNSEDRDRLYFKVIKETVTALFQNNTTHPIYEIGKVVVTDAVEIEDIAVKVSEMKRVDEKMVAIMEDHFFSKRNSNVFASVISKDQGMMYSTDFYAVKIGSARVGYLEYEVPVQRATSEVSEAFIEANGEAAAAREKNEPIPFRSFGNIFLKYGGAFHVGRIPVCHLADDGKVTWYHGYLQKLSDNTYELAFRVGADRNLTIPKGYLYANVSTVVPEGNILPDWDWNLED